MKKLFTTLACTLFACMALTACGGNAFAATLPESFVPDNGRIFQIHSVLSVEQAPGAINVKQSSGSVFILPDATGAVWAKVLANPTFYQHYVQVPGTNRYMNTQFAAEISCISNQTAFSYGQSNSPVEWFADSCALWNAVKAKAN
jgi:hypothetical protein